MKNADHDAQDQRFPKDSSDKPSHTGEGAASALSELGRQRHEHPAAGDWKPGTRVPSVRLFTTWATILKQAIALEDQVASGGADADAALAVQAAALKAEAEALQQAALLRFRQELEERGITS
ncbi:MAG TPA: hypothetical protein VIL30_25765 [Ramlibacter sp.]|jgi:hypothetical protein